MSILYSIPSCMCTVHEIFGKLFSKQSVVLFDFVLENIYVINGQCVLVKNKIIDAIVLMYAEKTSAFCFALFEYFDLEKWKIVFVLISERECVWVEV